MPLIQHGGKVKLTIKDLKRIVEAFVVDMKGNVNRPQQYLTSIDDMAEAINLEQTLSDIYSDASNVADMFKDPRLEELELEIGDYLNRAAMSDLIYVDDKGYKADEFLTIIVYYIGGYGFKPHSLLSAVFNNSQISLGYPASRVGKSEYNLEYKQKSENSIVLITLSLFFHPVLTFNEELRDWEEVYSPEDSNEHANEYMYDYFVPLINNSNFKIAPLPRSELAYGVDTTFIIIGTKKNFDKYGDDYEKILDDFSIIAKRNMEVDGLLESIDDEQAIDDVHEYHPPATKSDKDFRDLLYSNDYLADILSSLDGQDHEKFIDSILHHISNEYSRPSWDPDRNIPCLITALDAQNKSQRDGFVDIVANSIGYSFMGLENLVSIIQGL